MHKVFYASGFLYHPPLQQILLQQVHNGSSSWSLIGGVSLNEETAEEAFQRIIFTTLNIKLTLQTIYLVYSYSKEGHGKQQVIFYAEVDRINQIRANEKNALSWFTRKQIQKLPLDEQTRQDLIVGQRVIDARMRKNLGLHSLE